MTQRRVYLDLDDIIDEWLGNLGVQIDWDFHELVNHRDYTDIVLTFDEGSIHGKYSDVKFVLDMYGEEDV